MLGSMFAALVALILLGIPVFLALAVVGLTGVFLTPDLPLPVVECGRPQAFPLAEFRNRHPAFSTTPQHSTPKRFSTWFTSLGHHLSPGIELTRKRIPFQSTREVKMSFAGRLLRARGSPYREFQTLIAGV